MKTLALVFVAGLSTAFATEYPMQKVNRVNAVHFGQAQAEVEHLLEKKAVTDDSGISRAGTDFSLEAPGMKIDFDTGKLVGITFDAAYSFNEAIAMFPDAWQNLEPIGAVRMKKGMLKSEFQEYLKAWEARAKQSGARRNDGNKLLQKGEYSVRLTQDDFTDMISIGFGPERSTGKGGSWGSGCIVSFVTGKLAPMSRQKAGTLDSISVLCDEFNTHARRP
jgi:hypothetical protein